MADFRVIDGKMIADGIRAGIAEAVAARAREGKPAPGLATVLVGQVRAMAVDLLRSTGMNQAQALAALEGAAPRPPGEALRSGLLALIVFVGIFLSFSRAAWALTVVTILLIGILLVATKRTAKARARVLTLGALGILLMANVVAAWARRGAGAVTGRATLSRP